MDTWQSRLPMAPVRLLGCLGLEVLAEEFGEMQVSLFTLPEGFDLAPIFAAMPEGRCPVRHWGRVLEARAAFQQERGRETRGSSARRLLMVPHL